MSNDDDLYSIAEEPIAVLRQRFVIICNDNHCAAMLLDKFCAVEATAREYAFHCKESYDPYYSCTITKLTEDLYGLFDENEVADAFQFLINSDYISGYYTQKNHDELPLLDRQMKVRYQPKAVEEAQDSYGIRQTTWMDIPPEVRDQIPSSSPQISEEEKAETERRKRLNEEQSRVKSHNKRARKIGLEATLTLEQWIETLEHFGWKCAYCQEGKYTVLEHFIPITHGGGTTQNNCVPACHACNGIKQAWNPLTSYGPDFSSIREGLDRVRVYLEALK